jgi:hypothetical protein
VGRKCISKQLRDLIFGMVAENPTWGAPRIHGGLKVLGFDISERTVLRWTGGAKEPWAGMALDGVSEKPPRSDRGDGFLHCADARVWGPVLPLRHCA